MHNLGSWGIRLQCSPGVEAQGEVVPAPDPNCRARNWTSVASVSPTTGRGRHSTVLRLNLPTSATEGAPGCCGVDKRRKRTMRDRVGTTCAKHVASIALLSGAAETRLQGEGSRSRDHRRAWAIRGFLPGPNMAEPYAFALTVKASGLHCPLATWRPPSGSTLLRIRPATYPLPRWRPAGGTRARSLARTPSRARTHSRPPPPPQVVSVFRLD